MDDTIQEFENLKQIIEEEAASYDDSEEVIELDAEDSEEVKEEIPWNRTVTESFRDPLVKRYESLIKNQQGKRDLFANKSEQEKAEHYVNKAKETGSSEDWVQAIKHINLAGAQ